MRKFLVFFTVFTLFFASSTACVAQNYKLPKNQRKIYVQEVEQLINNDTIQVKKNVDKIYKSSMQIYNTFLKNKNQMKINNDYVNQLDNMIDEVSGANFYLYIKLIDTTDKYISVKNNVPTTDFAGSLHTYIYPYLKKNKIENIDKLDELFSYIAFISKEIENIKQSIYDYSVEYETTKNQNYLNKFKKRIGHLDDDILFQQTGELNKNIIYTTRAQVFQILSNGVLASTATGQGATIYIQTSKAQDLVYGDVFLPCIPLRFTGQYYTYTTITGIRNYVPIFKEVLPAEYKKITKFVSPADKYYFIEPYYIEAQSFDIVLENYYYPSQTRYFRRGY